MKTFTVGRLGMSDSRRLLAKRKLVKLTPELEGCGGDCIVWRSRGLRDLILRWLRRHGQLSSAQMRAWLIHTTAQELEQELRKMRDEGLIAAVGCRWYIRRPV